MTTLAEVRDGLATAVSAGTGLRSFGYLSSTIPHPCAFVQLGAYDPRFVLKRSKTEFNFTVTVFLGPASERSVQLRCDEIREPSGTQSVVEAVETESNWPVSVDYASVTLVGEPTEVTVAGDEILMAVEFDIEVVF